MVIVGGVDIPLIEILLVMAFIIFLLLVECIVIIALLMRQMSSTRKIGQAVERLSEAILQIKKAEIEELDRIGARIGKKK
ncbi:MAG: hypothetical protein Q8R37_02270 [Nanoarchaeota archaeon]|nr:hypothetical protein [Nanoarchaeota archaeon]